MITFPRRRSSVRPRPYSPPHLPSTRLHTPVRRIVPLAARQHRIEQILVSSQCFDMEGKKLGKSTKPRSTPFRMKHAVEYGLRVNTVDPESYIVTSISCSFASRSVARRFQVSSVRRQIFSRHPRRRSGRRITGPNYSASIRRSEQCTRTLRPVKKRPTSM